MEIACMPFARAVRSASNQPTCSRRHAIVMGGSIAGLLASRVLADQFERVTLIERDHFPSEPIFRQGVPQGRHLHVLLKQGCNILEQLFPGLQDELVAAGATLIDMAADAEWLYPAGWGVRFSSGLITLSCSRVLLEWTIRQRVAALPQVRFLPAQDVKGLVANSEQTVITGVELHSPDGSKTTEQADLIVDASGRRSKTPQWLTALGYTAPEETVIQANLGYASRIYKRSEDFHANWQGLYLQTVPPELTRGCALLPIENDRWIVTLMGGAENYPPTDNAGFLEFARSLRSPLLYDAIKTAEPLTPVYSYRATENRLRHYERLSRFPENFVVLGDAVCAFNPVYGQGMTMAAIGAVTLGNYLQQQRQQTVRGLSFQKQLAQRNTTAWQLATGEDCRYLNPADASLNWQTRLMHRYVDQVVQLSVKSSSVRQALLEVVNLVKPPTALFHPVILWQIVKQIYASNPLQAPEPLPPTLKREF